MHCASWKLSVEAMLAEINLVLTEKKVFDYRN